MTEWAIWPYLFAAALLVVLYDQVTGGRKTKRLEEEHERLRQPPEG